MTDSEELRRLAQAATPGPWEKGAIVGLQFPIVCCAMDGIRLNVAHVAGIRNGEGLNNAKFIAAANPAVVLELLDEIERLQSALSEIGMTPDEARAGVALNRAACTTLSANQGGE